DVSDVIRSQGDSHTLVCGGARQVGRINQRRGSSLRGVNFGNEYTRLRVCRRRGRLVGGSGGDEGRIRGTRRSYHVGMPGRIHRNSPSLISISECTRICAVSAQVGGINKRGIL